MLEWRKPSCEIKEGQTLFFFTHPLFWIVPTSSIPNLFLWGQPYTGLRRISSWHQSIFCTVLWQPILTADVILGNFCMSSRVTSISKTFFSFKGTSIKPYQYTHKKCRNLSCLNRSPLFRHLEKLLTFISNQHWTVDKKCLVIFSVLDVVSVFPWEKLGSSLALNADKGRAVSSVPVVKIEAAWYFLGISQYCLPYWSCFL